MRRLTICLLLSFLLTADISSQIVVGRMVDGSGVGLENVSLQLYSSPFVYDTVSTIDGTFQFTIDVLTAAEDEQLPTDYAVSNNFPNPFNPKTRIGVTLPVNGNVKLEVFNILGQSVASKIDRNFEAGTNYIDIDLHGLSNGMYISRIVIDDKFVVVRKMMLVYGSQHLAAGSGGQIPKSGQIFDTVLDSLVATHSVYGTRTFTGLPVFTGDTLDLGTFMMGEGVCPPQITYEGRIYHTVEINGQCWLKRNLNVGTMIPGALEQNNNGVIEKYCYGNDSANCEIYGALYQWHEAMQFETTPGVRGICPEGWHIPTVEEYEILIESLGCDGNALKAIGQGTGNGAGTNTSGFTALLSGRRYSNGTFGSLGSLGIFWSSTEFSGFYGIYLHLYNTGKIVGLPDLSKKYGFCVRCIKDS